MVTNEFLKAVNNVSDAALKYAGSAILPSVDQIRFELNKLFGGGDVSIKAPSSAANDVDIKDESPKTKA